MITDFGQHPNFQKKIDVERLADYVRCWPGINYSVSSCELKLLWIAEYLPKAMSKAWPGSRWNENVFLWRQIILHDNQVYKREWLYCFALHDLVER